MVREFLRANPDDPDWAVSDAAQEAQRTDPTGTFVRFLARGIAYVAIGIGSEPDGSAIVQVFNLKQDGCSLRRHVPYYRAVDPADPYRLAWCWPGEVDSALAGVGAPTRRSSPEEE